ncbi:MAG TPA: thiamine pyrophosphate-binding protein [Kofleriaceae bacterium]|nr:thiamine pyrophosphate-binding protein [Kofleriaceae bacterium]
MKSTKPADNGGAIIADVLARRGVRFLFTLCGGHISPILVESKRRGLHVVDVRDEGNAVFAADAVARMSGVPGVAAVTAGPGVTNTITALKNAQMAQSPIVLFGGATATVLKGRGSLQDIDQLSLMRPLTKWATTIKAMADLGPAVDQAFEVATSGVPGPVFLEVPVDLLYKEDLVRGWYMKESGVENAKGLGARVLKLYLGGHLYRQFHGPRTPGAGLRTELRVPSFSEAVASLPPPSRDTAGVVRSVADKLATAQRPVLVIGSQTLVNVRDPERVAEAVRRLGVPTFLGGMGRGLLGRKDPLQLRHHRGKALKEADLVIVCGFPFDFRLSYGRSIGKKATLVAVNLSTSELRKNRRPEIAVQAHPGEFLADLAAIAGSAEARIGPWMETLRGREAGRDAEIAAQGASKTELVNPLSFFLRLEEKMADDAVLVVDGGDFVATASYVLRPRGPLSWLDPGVFGTLGVGGGFATGAALCRPKSEIWLIYGDGSSAYSLAEFDTYVRHGLAPIAVVGNDGSWAQIAREQVDILGDEVGTVLRRSDYHVVAQGYGGVGLLLDDPDRTDEILDQAKALAASGKPVCINVHIARSEFRKGSMSM